SQRHPPGAWRRHTVSLISGLGIGTCSTAAAQSRVYTKANLLAQARSGRVRYERQDDTQQTVRIWGDTAVITALLTETGSDDGRPFDYDVWFSDSYVRAPS